MISYILAPADLYVLDQEFALSLSLFPAGQ
jgi:hypothetical protein